jgi:hypothetical protein
VGELDMAAREGHADRLLGQRRRAIAGGRQNRMLVM